MPMWLGGRKAVTLPRKDARMPPQSLELPAPDADLKLSWEIQKLQSEVHALHRPFRNPAVVAALITTTALAMVGLGGLVIQWLDRNAN